MMEEKMYYVITFTRDDGAVWMVAVETEEGAQELIRLVREGSDGGLLIQEPIEVEHINFL